MRRVPAVARQEAPDEELPGMRIEPIEIASLDVERDDAGPFGDHVGDPKPMTKRVDDGHGDAEDDEDGECCGVERAPVVGGRPVEDELVSGRNLVEPGEG